MSMPEVLPEMVVLVIVRVDWLPLLMPPPELAELPEMVELMIKDVPEVVLILLMPPPPNLFAELPEMVELETVRLPRLRKAPPVLEFWAPETVTPEIDRSPPISMPKALKLRLETPLSPLIVSEDAPRPLMVTVPAVPAPTVLLASTMLGNAVAKVMV